MNRNKLIEVFISNISNAVIHQILEKAIDRKEISEKYQKEVKNSWEIAIKYREKINPVNRSLSGQDNEEIKRKIVNKVKAELKIRIERGYENIDFSIVEDFVDNALKQMKIMN
ncbi:MAG: hypothetical protein Q7S74_05815 [Nanoarchaeota archaeon]|nr:hypothetical protein [Nanoarchaeota archaeon]